MKLLQQGAQIHSFISKTEQLWPHYRSVRWIWSETFSYKTFSLIFQITVFNQQICQFYVIQIFGKRVFVHIILQRKRKYFGWAELFLVKKCLTGVRTSWWCHKYWMMSLSKREPKEQKNFQKHPLAVLQ